MRGLGRCEWACLIGMTTLLLDSCGLNYHLQGQGRAAILLPPIVPASSKDVPPVSRIRITNARSRSSTLDGCDIHNDLLELRWLGNTAEIELRPESYFPAPGDERPEEVAPRMYLDSVHTLEAFRDALQDGVIRNCLRSYDAQAITRAIAERFPLPPLIATLIRFGIAAAGYYDLTADFRPTVLSPVYDSDSSREVVDYQIAYYHLTPGPKDGRIQISLSSVVTGRSKEGARDESVTTQTLAFPASFRFFRLVLRTGSSSANHVATILSSDDEANLRQATRWFVMTRDPSCKLISIPNLTCVDPPPDVAVNLEFPVSVNGKQVFVPLVGPSSLHSCQGNAAARSSPHCVSKDCSKGTCVAWSLVD